MSEKYVVRLKNAAIYHADNPFGSTSAEKLMRGARWCCRM